MPLLTWQELTRRDFALRLCCQGAGRLDDGVPGRSLSSTTLSGGAECRQEGWTRRSDRCTQGLNLFYDCVQGRSLSSTTLSDAPYLAKHDVIERDLGIILRVEEV